MSIYPKSFVGLETKDELFEKLAREISASFSKVFVTRAYIAIIDAAGNFHYIDTPAFDEHLYFIQNYVTDNFQLMEIGDCNIPFGGVSLAFFKVTQKALIILYAPAGPSGMLISFKTRMYDFSERIDELIGEVEFEDSQDTVPEPPDTTFDSMWEEAPRPTKKEEAGVKRFPVLKKKLTGKEKFSLQVINFLQHCNGTNTLEDIARLTNVPHLKVDLMIRDLIKKGYLNLKRTLK
ncbi:MAG TPA: hypothetical protein VMV49_05250 [Candidatus Deferrimicrobium sp.]|nr:hypothetical protein [Candidatus Deferrimicrobium sp.]